MQWKVRIALGLVVGLVAMAGGGGAQGATSNTSHITIQDATLISPTEILLTGTTTCPADTFMTGSVTEDNGASGSGFFFQGSTTDWAMKIVGTNFVKTKADVFVTGQPDCPATAERTMLVH